MTPGHLPTWLLPLAITRVVVQWVVSAEIVLKTPDGAILSFPSNLEPFSLPRVKGAHLLFPFYPLFFDYSVSFSSL